MPVEEDSDCSTKILKSPNSSTSLAQNWLSRIQSCGRWDGSVPTVWVAGAGDCDSEWE